HGGVGNLNKKQPFDRAFSCAPDRIRICNLLLRKQTLYPIALQGQSASNEAPYLYRSPRKSSRNHHLFQCYNWALLFDQKGGVCLRLRKLSMPCAQSTTQSWGAAWSI